MDELLSGRDPAIGFFALRAESKERDLSVAGEYRARNRDFLFMNRATDADAPPFLFHDILLPLKEQGVSPSPRPRMVGADKETLGRGRSVRNPLAKEIYDHAPQGDDERGICPEVGMRKICREIG